MPFIDIAFRAEISCYEDDEFEEFARRNCNENPETRAKAVEELRRMIYERGECHPRRMDDAYLLRFLRCRRFVPASAYRLLVRYENFKQKNASLYQGIDCFGLQKVKGVCGGVYPENPENGRITVIKLGRWDVDEISIEDIVRCTLIMGELAVRQPRLQILGVTMLVDLEGLSFKQVRQFTSTVASQAVSLLGVDFPVLINGVHLINYSWILKNCFYIYKQLIPSGAWNRLHFHGQDFDSLHKYMAAENLPPEYGGTNTNSFIITTEEWLAKINMFKDERLVKELRDLGFVVN